MITLQQLSDETGANLSTINHRWERGIRDPAVLGNPGKLWAATPDEPPPERTHHPPILTPERRAYLLEMARYSMGQENQKYILCDLLPCDRRHADYLMEALGL
jgi:hypothetical protein